MPFCLPLGLSSFVVCAANFTEVELNGLPKLPPSVSAFARLQSLRHLRHPSICRYVDVVRKKPERLFVVTESFSKNLSHFEGPVADANWIASRFTECLLGLDYLSEHNLIHCLLTPESVFLDDFDHAKISGYGLYYASLWGRNVDFPVADPAYSAPEVFLFSTIAEKKCLSNGQQIPTVWNSRTASRLLGVEADMWSLGLIFSELIYGRCVFSTLHQHRQSVENTPSFVCRTPPYSTIRTILEGLRQCENGSSNLLEFLGVNATVSEKKNIRPIADVCKDCLHFNATLRPKPLVAVSKLADSFHVNISKTNVYRRECTEYNVASLHQLGEKEMEKSLFSPRIFSTEDEFVKDSNTMKAVDFLSCLSDPAEIYHYWCLAGGNLEKVWRDAQVIRSQIKQFSNSSDNECSRPPILRIPHYLAVMKHGSSELLYSKEQWPRNYRSGPHSFDSRVIPLPGERLMERIRRMPLNVLYPLFFCPEIILNGEFDSTYFDVRTTKSTRGPPSCIVPYNRYEMGSMQLLFSNDLPRGFEFKSVGKNQRPDSLPIGDQPISVKQSDIEYQIRRIRLFRRLLNGLPATEEYVRREARKDIPPFLRSKIWAALLGIHRDPLYRQRYAKALCSTTPSESTKEKEQASGEFGGTSDRLSVDITDPIYGRLDEKAANQIAVDLPRCHGYDGLLASSIGQSSLRRVLVATLLMQPGTFEYTQGMDSVAAVFVRLCYPDEALAAACLHSLLTTKLPSFFSTGGFTVGLKAFFNVLLRLFVFHMPHLAIAFVDLNVPLVGLTTGWIYTLFAHAMPLDRTEILWDTLIAGPPSLSMFVYIAIFLQLDQQINFESLDVEKICTILSNFPEVDLDRCRSDALLFALATPKSLTLGPGVNLPPWSVNDDAVPFSFESLHLRGSGLHPSAPPDRSYPATCSTLPPDCSFYEQLSTPGAWPEHLEMGSAHSDESCPSVHSKSDSKSPSSEAVHSWLTDGPLIPFLDPEDALEHMRRPDCFVLDVRNRSEYIKGCIPGSVHRSQVQLSSSNSRLNADESLAKSESSASLGTEWELIDSTSRGRRHSRAISPFLADLMNESSWQRAVQARRMASQRQLAGLRTSSCSVCSSNTNCPGLTVILGGSETSRCDSSSPKPSAIMVCEWLIRQEVDHVCVLRGGAPALMNLPGGMDLFVCPTPSSLND
ncbi:unnamed protein product [Calicophoron daubneyi]|uniref:TBC domain-containing protein kinase-like protein n=1 Tax=Calicophoron daubneyi TaxID=300641 RepID=A0AAV2TSC9_CALDB